MKKISYRLVYNRKKHLNANGKALIQVEAYLTGQKAYFSTHIYVKPEQWEFETRANRASSARRSVKPDA